MMVTVTGEHEGLARRFVSRLLYNHPPRALAWRLAGRGWSIR